MSGIFISEIEIPTAGETLIVLRQDGVATVKNSVEPLGWKYRRAIFVPDDVAPVRHGEWRVYSVKNCLYTCSECHCIPRDKTPYCPICGAKMDEVLK